MTYSCVKGSESLSHDRNQGGTASKSRPFVDGAFLFYRKLRRISYKVKKCSAWIALRRNRICRFATRRRRRILLGRILFSRHRKLRCISYDTKKRSAWIALRRKGICRFATRRRRRILLCRILFSLLGDDVAFPIKQKRYWRASL